MQIGLRLTTTAAQKEKGPRAMPVKKARQLRNLLNYFFLIMVMQ
jgi:hypothetical protein